MENSEWALYSRAILTSTLVKSNRHNAGFNALTPRLFAGKGIHGNKYYNLEKFAKWRKSRPRRRGARAFYTRCSWNVESYALGDFAQVPDLRLIASECVRWNSQGEKKRWR